MASKKANSAHLPFPDAVGLLRRNGIDFCETAFAYDENGITAASKLGFPVFLKVVSNPLSGAVHKAKSSLVAECGGPDALKKAFGRLQAAQAALAKKGILEKKLVIAVQKEASGIECIIGARHDALFGPVIIFGTGGVYAEEFNDIALRICPITDAEAAGMVMQTKAYSRISKLKSADLMVRKLSAALVKVSALISKSAVSEIDLNPVFVDEISGRVVAVDVRAVSSLPPKFSAKPSAWKDNLVSHFFQPSSIALIGASRDPSSVGHSIMRNLTIGCVHKCEYCRPFLGKIFPVNPFASEILGVKCYPSILKVPEQVDLAIIAVPQKIVLDAVNECIRKKVKSVIIISAGFGEAGEEGKELQDKIVEKLETARIPMLGPNCLGFVRPGHNLNASFGPSMH
jgi:acetate---CoA ligase (ADP-forming)